MEKKSFCLFLRLRSKRNEAKKKEINVWGSNKYDDAHGILMFRSMTRQKDTKMSKFPSSKQMCVHKFALKPFFKDDNKRSSAPNYCHQKVKEGIPLHNFSVMILNNDVEHQKAEVILTPV